MPGHYGGGKMPAKKKKMTGKAAPNNSGDVFRSQQELVAAMSDARYDRDPAYRQDVIEKLDRSNLEF